MDALKLYTSLSVSFVKRPPHNCAMINSSFLFYFIVKKCALSHFPVLVYHIFYILQSLLFFSLFLKKHIRSNPDGTAHIHGKLNRTLISVLFLKIRGRCATSYKGESASPISLSFSAFFKGLMVRVVAK